MFVDCIFEMCTIYKDILRNYLNKTNIFNPEIDFDFDLVIEIDALIVQESSSVEN